MAGYEVQHRYQSWRDGQQFGPWQAGETVELSEADAAWIGRDSAGVLLAADGVVEPPEEPVVAEEEPERQKPAGRNRQHRPGPNRGQ